MAKSKIIIDGVDTTILTKIADVLVKDNVMELRNIQKISFSSLQLLCAIKRDYGFKILLFANTEISNLLVNTGFKEIFEIETDKK